MKAMNKMTASRLRLVLMGSIVLLALLIGFGFYSAQSFLHNFAVTVSHAQEDANASESDISTLQKLEDKLAEDELVIERTKKIVADSKAYEYQDQIIADLNAYAAKSGVAITGFTFTDSNAAPSSAASPEATGTAAEPAIPGLKSTSVSVQLATPTKYDRLMRFVGHIEQNLTKMQLASLTLSKGQAKDEVTTSELVIGVYVK